MKNLQHLWIKSLNSKPIQVKEKNLATWQKRIRTGADGKEEKMKLGACDKYFELKFGYN